MESAKRAAAREKALKKKIARQETDEKHKRLIARGELLESLLGGAARMSDEQLAEILTLAFSQSAVKAAVHDAAQSVSNNPSPTHVMQEDTEHE